MKKSLIIILLISVLFACISCNTEQEQNKNNLEYLFPEGVVIPEQNYDVDVFTGTYLLSKGLEAYAYVSFDNSGTAVVVPVSYYLHPSSNTLSYGAWQKDGSFTKINILGQELTISSSSYTKNSDGIKNGFYYKLNSLSTWYFTKVSDDLINIDVYSDKSIICEKSWGKTDDYGFTKGYKFNSNGTCTYHSNETDNVILYSYKTAVNKPLLTIGDNALSVTDETSYVLIGNYLYLGLTAYGCYGSSIPTKVSIIGTSLSVNDLSGMYIFTDSDTGKYSDGYCCLQNSGLYWQVRKGIQKTGTWHLSEGTNVVISIDGQGSDIYNFTSSQYLKKDNAQYPSATRISRFTNYFYGLYEGTELQIKNTVCGSWWNRDAKIGFTFNTDYSATVFTFDTNSNIWNGLSGFTWSYSNGQITLSGNDMTIYLIAASAYGEVGEKELYLQQNVYTQNP